MFPDGDILVSIENEIVIANTIDRDPIDVKFISFAASKGNHIDVYYNCPKKNGPSTINCDAIETGANGANEMYAASIATILSVIFCFMLGSHI